MHRPSNAARCLHPGVIALALVAGCGQMYQAPGGQAAPAPPSPGAAPAAPAPVEPDPAPPEDRAPRDPYPEAAPAAAPVGRRPTPPRAPTGDADAMVAAHNRVRAKHCAGPLAWSPQLAQVAQRWANSLRDKGCMFGHSGGSFGENLAAGTSGVLDPEAVVKMWYDEVQQYRFPDGGFSMKTGHFTQVVWRGTTHVGCGHTTCKGMDIWVCEYDPAGNWEGQYRENVLPVGCR